MDFGRELAPGCVLGVALGSEGGVAEGDSLKSRDFSLISCRESILRLCLAWISATAVVTTDVITLVIDCWKEKSMIWELATISLKQETVVENLSTFVSQEES